MRQLGRRHPRSLRQPFSPTRRGSTMGSDRLLRVGVVPILEGSGGGIYQYSVTMLDGLLAIEPRPEEKARLAALALTLGYFLVRRTVGVVPALMGILFVGLHPLAVESVAWIVGRKDVLALLLLFATLLAADRETPTRSR